MNIDLKKQIELSYYFSKVDKKIEYKYSKEKINQFEKLLASENIDLIFLFLLKNRVNFSDFGLELSNFSSIANKLTGEELEIFLNSNIVKESKFFIKNNLLRQKNFYISILNNLVKNKTRQKGSSHFTKKANKYFKDKINSEEPRPKGRGFNNLNFNQNWCSV